MAISTTSEHRAPEYVAFIDTDCCKFRVSIDVKLFPVSTTDAEEADFRARQLLDLFRAAIENETRHISFLNSLVLQKDGGLPVHHSHCECRNTRCGHLDIRHDGKGGRCTYPGCECEEWS